MREKIAMSSLNVASDGSRNSLSDEEVETNSYNEERTQGRLTLRILAQHERFFWRQKWRIQVRTMAGTRVGIAGLCQSYDDIFTFPAHFKVADTLNTKYWYKEVTQEEATTVWDGAEGKIWIAQLEWKPKALILANGICAKSDSDLPIGYGSSRHDNEVFAINTTDRKENTDGTAKKMEITALDDLVLGASASCYPNKHKNKRQ